MNIFHIWHSSMFYYCTALLVHTFSYFIWCFIQMLETLMVMFKFTWCNWRWLWCVRMLHFTRHYKDTIQERLTILILFSSSFVGVHVCQKLSKPSLVWQIYWKNSIWCSFLDSQCISRSVLGLLSYCCFIEVQFWARQESRTFVWT